MRRSPSSGHRYADKVDKHGAGLTEYLVAAVLANAKRAPIAAP